MAKHTNTNPDAQETIVKLFHQHIPSLSNQHYCQLDIIADQEHSIVGPENLIRAYAEFRNKVFPQGFDRIESVIVWLRGGAAEICSYHREVWALP